MAFYAVLLARMHRMDIYPRRWTKRDEFLKNSYGVLYEYAIIIESRSHSITNSGTFLTIFETNLYFQSIHTCLFTEAIRDLFVTYPSSL